MTASASSPAALAGIDTAEIGRLLAGDHDDPHRILGAHRSMPAHAFPHPSQPAIGGQPCLTAEAISRSRDPSFAHWRNPSANSFPLRANQPSPAKPARPLRVDVDCPPH